MPYNTQALKDKNVDSLPKYLYDDENPIRANFVGVWANDRLIPKTGNEQACNFPVGINSRNGSKKNTVVKNPNRYKFDAKEQIVEGEVYYWFTYQ